MILDTSFLLDLKDEDRDAFRKSDELSRSNADLKITLTTISELYYGVSYSGSSEERRSVENLLLFYHTVKPTEEIAERKGELLADVDKRYGGEAGVGHRDAMIAAAGDTLGEPVLTDNVRDFNKLGVEVETY